MKHLRAGTEVRLTRELTEEEHACTGLVLPLGCRGILVDEDGDIGFRPSAKFKFIFLSRHRCFIHCLESWCCFLEREDYEFDATPYEDDPNLIEVCKGVFVSAGEAIYIVDECGEVTSWNQDEWAEDAESVTACAVACIVAAQKGAGAVRRNIELSGSIVRDMIARGSEL
jgi:hypothetical protein